jgi:hypothetical protein
MRPLYALIVCVVIFGGLWAYTAARDALDRPQASVVEILPAPGIYELEVTPMADAISSVDKFGTDLTPQPSIVVLLNGREIVNLRETARSGIPQKFTWNTDETPMKYEKNELYLRLAAPAGDAEAFRGARVRLLRDGATIADEMLWSQPGAPVEGDVDIYVKPPPATADDHQH